MNNTVKHSEHPEYCTCTGCWQTVRCKVQGLQAEVGELRKCFADANHKQLLAEAEVARLTDCLKTANGHHEHFERRWYLCQDRISELEAGLREIVRLPFECLDDCKDIAHRLLDGRGE